MDGMDNYGRIFEMVNLIESHESSVGVLQNCNKHKLKKKKTT